MKKFEDYDESELLRKYPFMQQRNVFTGEIDKENIGKTYFNWCPEAWIPILIAWCEEILPEYNSFSDMKQKQFRILDIKEKYGSLRIDTTLYSEKLSLATWKAGARAELTCYTCGKQPRNSKGEHMIWESRGWIFPYCKECAKKYYFERCKHDVLFQKVFNRYVCKGNKIYIKSSGQDGCKITACELGEW